ncbi:MAG TPA: ABC transporter ATP-binding protein [Polyangiaceae bacterium]|jgi:simple sugar transport system ATP-binding protein|nr:ABC transporter ATP-binding protein [Polyangiaceae bacterium]
MSSPEGSSGGADDNPRNSVTRIRPATALLAMHGVTKRFGKKTVLEDVSLHVHAGEIHCLLGENGAGKSTLCNIVFGVHRADEGTLELNGQRFEPDGPSHALRSGVAMVHQHFSLVGNMTALENLMLGRARGLLDTRGIEQRVAGLSSQFGLEVELRKPVEDLSVGERQRIEIVKCLLENPRLLVLDEPTAVLPPREVAGLLEICRKVAKDGCGVVLVTHKLTEIGAIAHKTSVLRRGKVVETVTMEGADMGALVRAMVGREVRSLEVAPRAAAAERTSPAPAFAQGLKLDALQWKNDAGVTRLDLGLTVKPGEIVGIAGVEGNGQSELGDILAGLMPPSAGRVFIGGQDVTGLPPRELTRRGIGIVPEDRHRVGCHVDLTVTENLFLGQTARFSRFGLLLRRKMRRAAEALLTQFDVRGGPDDRFGDLSGGNQQKVVLARELTLEPLVFLLAAQPTRGLDVGAVEAVYGHIRKARDRGTAVLLVSSELDELLAVADRVVVLYRGRVVGEVPAGRGQTEAIGALMSGQTPEPQGAVA